MRQLHLHRRGGPQRPLGLQEGARIVVGRVYGRRQQYFEEAREKQRARSTPSTSTVTSRSCPYSRRHARMLYVSFVFWTLVSLLFMRLGPRDPLDTRQFFGVKPTEAASQDNIDYDDIVDTASATRYVRVSTSSNTETESYKGPLLASSMPYLFEKEGSRQRATSDTSSHNEVFSSTSDVKETGKTCALIILAHDWPLSPRHADKSHGPLSYDWSDLWHFLQQELERRAEFETVVVYAPDVSNYGGRGRSVVTSLHHYSAYLARQTRLLLQSMLRPDPEAERRASVIERQEALAARLSALFPPESLDDVFYFPVPEEMVTRWFNEAAMSPGDSRTTSRSSGQQHRPTSRSGVSSPFGSVHESRDRVSRATATSPLGVSSASSELRGPSSPLPAGLLESGFGEEKSTGQSQRPSHLTAGSGATRRSNFQRRRKLSFEEESKVTWTTEDDTSDHNSVKEIDLYISPDCASIDLFLLGRGVGALALRLMAASPSSALWDGSSGSGNENWRTEVWDLHTWLSEKMLGLDGARINIDRDASRGGSSGQSPGGRSVGSASHPSWWDFYSLHSPTFRSSGGGRTTVLNMSATDTSSSSSSRLPRTYRFGASYRRGRYSAVERGGQSTSASGAPETSRTSILGSVVKEEAEDDEDAEEDVGTNTPLGEDEEGARAQVRINTPPAATHMTGVRLRSFLLDHAFLAGKGPRADKPRSAGSFVKFLKAKTKWNWGAIREAFRRSHPGQRLPDPSIDLRRILHHMDPNQLLCTLAHTEKQTYVFGQETRGSLATQFRSVLYYGNLDVKNPAATASQLGIAYPNLMHSIAAKKAERCDDPLRPCKMIDAAASPLNSPAGNTARRCMPFRGVPGTNVRERQAQGPPSSRRSRHPGAGSFSFLLSGLRRRIYGTSDISEALQDTTEGSSVERRRRAAGGEQQSTPATGEAASEERRKKSSAALGTATSSVVRKKSYRPEAAAVVEGHTDENDDSESEQGYEAGAESACDTEDCDNSKERKQIRASCTAEDRRQESCAASRRKHGVQNILFTVDICKMTKRYNLHDVTLALLEAINYNQRPQPYNPVRFGIWESTRTSKPVDGHRKPGEDGVHRDLTLPEVLTEEKQRVLTHMAVRFFQGPKSVRRWDFSGDKHIYTREWFMSRRATSRSRRSLKSRRRRS